MSDILDLLKAIKTDRRLEDSLLLTGVINGAIKEIEDLRMKLRPKGSDLDFEKIQQMIYNGECEY
jgi:hypothetical protein